MKKIYLFAISVMLLATSCGHKKEGDATLIRPVKTATASSQSVIRKDFSGIVEAVEYVKLAFRVSGQVINLPVVEGQRVKKGQLIAAIDPRDISLQYAADKAAYENQKTYVWVVKDNKVSKREVTVYSPTGEANALISTGVQPGETIVIAGVHQLVEGQTVKVIN